MKQEISINQGRNKEKLNVFDFLYKYGTVLVIIGTLVFFAFTLDNFFTFGNISNVFRSVSIVTLIALAITVVSNTPWPLLSQIA